jgi:hypothetical protein
VDPRAGRERSGNEKLLDRTRFVVLFLSFSFVVLLFLFSYCYFIRTASVV